MSQRGFYTPRAAVIRLLMLLGLIYGCYWVGWKWNARGDVGMVFVQAVASGVLFVLLLGIPFMLKDLWEAVNYARTSRREQERARTLTGRHDTGLKPRQGKADDAPDNWQ